MVAAGSRNMERGIAEKTSSRSRERWEAASGEQRIWQVEWWPPEGCCAERRCAKRVTGPSFLESNDAGRSWG